METVKRVLLVSVAAILLFSVFQDRAFAVEKKVKLKVSGVTCISLAWEVEAIPKRFAGVRSSEFDFAGSTVTVVFDDATVSIEDLVTAFKEANLPVVEEPMVLE